MLNQHLLACHYFHLTSGKQIIGFALAVWAGWECDADSLDNYCRHRSCLNGCIFQIVQLPGSIHVPYLKKQQSWVFVTQLLGNSGLFLLAAHHTAAMSGLWMILATFYGEGKPCRVRAVDNASWHLYKRANIGLLWLAAACDWIYSHHQQSISSYSFCSARCAHTSMEDGVIPTSDVHCCQAMPMVTETNVSQIRKIITFLP